MTVPRPHSVGPGKMEQRPATPPTLGWLEISMDDAFAVDFAESAGDLRREKAHPRGRNRALFDQLCERLTDEKFHHQERLIGAEHAEVDDIDDVAMPDLHRQLCFEEKPLSRRFVLWLKHHFERERLVEHGVRGLIDHAHSALRQHFVDAVAIIDHRAFEPIVGLFRRAAQGTDVSGALKVSRATHRAGAGNGLGRTG